MAAARERYPDTAVEYRVADLLDLPADLVGAFDLVIEVSTVQALPPELRTAVAALDRRPHPRRPDGRPLWVARLRRAIPA